MIVHTECKYQGRDRRHLGWRLYTLSLVVDMITHLSQVDQCDAIKNGYSTQVQT